MSKAKQVLDMFEGRYLNNITPQDIKEVRAALLKFAEKTGVMRFKKEDKGHYIALFRILESAPIDLVGALIEKRNELMKKG